MGAAARGAHAMAARGAHAMAARGAHAMAARGAQWRHGAPTSWRHRLCASESVCAFPAVTTDAEEEPLLMQNAEFAMHLLRPRSSAALMTRELLPLGSSIEGVLIKTK